MIPQQPAPPPPAPPPVVLFGAFDRHNFGDLLFPHVLAALLPGREIRHAGLVGRDLRAVGGHRVEALSKLAAELAGRCATLIHAGGEILDCNAWQAAVMLLTPQQAREVTRRFDRHPRQGLTWAHGLLGTHALAPYASAPGWPRGHSRVVYHAVGGVALRSCDPGLRSEVLEALAAAHDVSVRDRRTLAQLRAAGITRARLIPDPAVMVARLFGESIATRAREGEPGAVAHRFPDGYLAVQLGADFGDDATLATVAAQLERVTAASGSAIALFRAGAAPWHDDLEVNRRLAARMRAEKVAVFESIDVHDICALIAGSRGYCGSSLHGRIVAGAFALPRVSLRHPSAVGAGAKQAAYCETWEPAAMPAVIGIDELARAMESALAVDRARLAAAATRMCERYLRGFEAQFLRADTRGNPDDTP